MKKEQAVKKLEPKEILASFGFLKVSVLKEVTVVIVPYKVGQTSVLLKNNTLILPFKTCKNSLRILVNYVVLDIIYLQDWLDGSCWVEGQKFIEATYYTTRKNDN
jgi:hypothetical protein